MSRREQTRERMLARVHQPLSRNPGPVLTALLSAFAAGLASFDLRALQRALYLHTARAGWLGEWAELYSYSRSGQSDAELLAQMERETILERRKTTTQAVEDALRREVGLEPLLFLGDKRVYRFDDMDALAQEGYAYDYSVIYQGREVYDDVPDTHRGSRAAMPWGPGFGPGGLWVTFGAQWNAERERAALGVLARHIKAGGGLTLGWSVRVKRDVTDALSAQDALTHPDMGWGIDPWGGSTWG